MTRRVRSIRAATALALAGGVAAHTADPVADLARQGPPHAAGETGHAALIQALRDARNDTVVAFVASHPDDQYVLPAAFLRFAHGYRVVVVLATRGEGGQNSRGPEVGDELAALRAVETEDCARRLGLIVHHLNLPDAGYSRTAEETLDLWGIEATTLAVARALREIRPDVVMTTHHPTDTHGHDLALAEVLPDAIAWAGDPRRDLAGLQPAPIDRFYRGVGEGEPVWFVLPAGDVDPERGVSYRDLAYHALTASHASQTPFREPSEFFGSTGAFLGVPIPGGPVDAPGADLHADLPDLFRALAGALPRADIDRLRETFDRTLPALVQNRPRLAAAALELRDQLLALRTDGIVEDSGRLDRRIEALDRVAIEALGLRVRAATARPTAVPGERVAFTLEVQSAGPVGVDALSLVPGGDGEPPPRITAAAALQKPQPWMVSGFLDVPENALERDPTTDLFRRSRFAMPFRVGLRLTLGGDAKPTLDVPVELPLAVRPPVELQLLPRAILVPDEPVPVRFNVRVRRHGKAPVREQLRVQVPPGFDVEPRTIDVDLGSVSEQGFLFELRVPDGLRPGPQPIRVRLGDLARARLELHRIAVAVAPDLRVGLVEGVDDAARTTLEQLGVDVELLTEATLPVRPLDDLDTILVDIRALRHHAAARAEFNRLLAFADAGGRLVVLYHKDSEFDAQLTGQRFFPTDLPLSIGRGRVTREDAPVEILDPDARLLTTPNRITAEDWDGWVQERGLYFPARWADGYQPLLRISDPGEPAEDGALLVASTGRGQFVYCALALHRQLKNLHPGACRLFANLVSHERPRGRR
ncbi:MAG: PIG-L deacetylase family protein [Planctomycetota bacterium]